MVLAELNQLGILALGLHPVAGFLYSKMYSLSLSSNTNFAITRLNIGQITKLKTFFLIYAGWAIEKCPAVVPMAFLLLRNRGSKSVNSFAGLSVQ